MTSLYRRFRTSSNFGTDLSGAKDLDGILTAANLNWEVKTTPVQTIHEGRLIDVPDFRTVIRTDTLKPLGVVGKSYRPFQNREALSIVDDFMKEGGVQVVRGGAFNHGSALFLTMELPGTMKIGPKGDEVAKFLTLVNSHDGSFLYRSLITPFRLFCSNQIRAVMGKFKESVSVRHTNGGWNKLEDARRSLQLANTYYGKFANLADTLARTKFSDSQMKELALSVFPGKNAENDNDDDVSKKTENARVKVYELFEGGAGHRETGIAGTAWGAINAVAEYVDYERNTRTTKGVESDFARSQAAWFGSGVQLKTQSFEVVRSMVGLAA